MGKLIDETGHRYSRLTVLYRDSQNTSDGKPKWVCKCDCGNICSVAGKQLRNGHTRSCGCLIKEITGNLNRLDLTNKIFGNLKALISIKKDGYVKWECECLLCGNHCFVETNHLTSGRTVSCGCLTKSKGESKIEKLLKEAKIPFVSQKRFDDFKNHIFDFYIKDQYIIEFDGIQHFKPNGGWNTPEQVKKVQERDKMKNDYCKMKNIPIIRIPYTHYNDIELKDLLIETSAYLLKHSEEANDND